MSQVTDLAASPQTTRMDGTAPAPTFAAVYSEQLAWMWRTLWRLGVPDRDLEDVAHDVFVVVHKKLQDYDPTRPLRPWLFGICFRVALDRRRKMSIARETPSERTEDVEWEAPSAPSLVENNEKKKLVHDALASLPLEQRAVFVLHELEGVSIPECVAVLDAPLNTLYSRLRLARAAFTRFVERQAP